MNNLPPKDVRESPGNSTYHIYVFGFHSICDGELPKPKCVVCGEVLSNEALKPTKLSRHSQTKHKDVISKPIEFFQRKRDEFKGSQRQMYVSSHKCFSTASFIQGSLS